MITNDWILTTKNLQICIATATNENISFLFSLWTNPDVMKFVGFPQGLRITKDEIKIQLQKEYPDEFDRVLLVSMKNSNTLIGNCKLGSPDENNIAHTDVKLMPEFQGHGCGTEIKQVLLNYLFKNTNCDSVKGTPNKNNIASIKMQEAVGGKRIKECCHHFPDSMKEYTTDVHFYEYLVYRSDWGNYKLMLKYYLES